MQGENYWIRALRQRISRRQALKAGVMAGAGIAATSVVGCGSTAPKVGTGTSSTTQQPKQGGILRDFTTGDPPHLDPHLHDSYRTIQTVAYALSRVLRYKTGQDVKPGDYEPVPDLAEKWEQPDELTYVFKLRQDVKWHNIPPVNGRELTAEDVKWSYDRITSSSLYKHYWDELDSVSVVDKYTIKCKLKNPYAPFLIVVASHFSWIMAKEVIDKYGDGKKNLIGTGPWYLEKYEPTIRFVFKRNPDYFDKNLPYLDGVEFLMIPDASTSLAGLRAKEIDIGGVSDTELASFKASRPDAQYRDYIGLGGNIYFSNVTKPPYNDVRIRRAVSMAIDRDGWIKAMFGGKGRWSTVIQPEHEYWAIPLDQLGEGLKYLQYNPEESKRLMAEAGYPNGIDIDLNSTPGYGTTHVQYVELIAGMLNKAGFRVSIKMKEYAAFMETTFRGDFEGIAFGPLRSYIDPDEIIYGKHYPGSIFNQTRVDDPKLTPLLVKQRRTLDKEERRKILWDIERYLALQQYLIFRPVGYVHEVTQPWVRNYWAQSGHSKDEMYPVWFDK